MVKLSLKVGLSLKALALCLLTKNILSVKSQEIADCAIIREASDSLGTNKTKFTSNNCCDLDVVTCNDKNVIGIKLFGISCHGSGAKIEDVIEKLTNLTHLESFEFSKQTWCQRPKNIPKLKNLKTLIMTGNNYKDTLPEDIVLLSELEKLDLSNNEYYDKIPNSYSKLKNLKSLKLNNNELSGYIPYNFKELENLTELNLAGNKLLKGYIPKMSKINKCDYSNTDLCSLKSTTCTNHLANSCTKEIVKFTNKNNGNPNPDSNEYEDDVNTFFLNSHSSVIKYIIVIIIIIILCCLCCKKFCGDDDDDYDDDDDDDDDNNNNYYNYYFMLFML